MAFFKFRFPGQATSSSAPPEAVGAGPGESIEVLRRRARHRLMGAVVLVVLAVLGFPMLFDTQPRPVAADTPVLIQDRHSAGPLSAAPQALVPPPPAVLPPDAPSLPVQAGLDANEEQVPAPAVDKPLEQAAPAKSRPIAAKTDVNQPASQAAKPEVKPQDDGSKARALLEGRSQTASKTTAAERHVVQVGAFSDPAKVREVRRKLEQAGVVTFIQVIEGQGGQSTTRIRVGPFNSREEAEKAAARIRQLNFAPAVLRL
jgi:DedD protein